MGAAARMLDNNPQNRNIVAQFKAASPELQSIYGFRMYKGRYFNEHDTASSEPVIIVNKAFAKLYSPADPAKFLGTKMLSLTSSGKDCTVIGILDDMRQRTVADPSFPEVEVDIAQVTPASQFYEAVEGIAIDLAVRTSRDPEAIIPEIREVLRQADPALAGSNFTTHGTGRRRLLRKPASCRASA